MNEEISSLYYEAIANDLRIAGLSREQTEEALIHNVDDSTSRAMISKAVTTKFGQFFTQNQYPEPNSTFDTNENDAAYIQQLKSKNSEHEKKENQEVTEVDLDRYSEGREQVINLITETAQLADNRGLHKQANLLDEILKDII